jgi:8-oxo-dGTP pyrophosphatase MutT (NUDIX family)
MGPVRPVRHAAPVGCRTGAVARLRSTTATSAGGIVIRQQSGVLEFVAGQRRREHAHTWTLPKGTPIPGETTEETALREVGEETGLEVRIIAPFDSIHYTFIQRGTKVNKTVHYFLMEPTGGDLARHDHEFEAVRWVAFADADGLLTFDTERALVAGAAAALANGQTGIATIEVDLGAGRDVPGEAAS